MAPSPKVATYDLKPEMSAQELVDKIIPELEKKEVDFVCLNFANPDMVGHTGVFSATVKAVETVDAAISGNGDSAEKWILVIVIADHAMQRS